MADIQERITKDGLKTFTARVRLKGHPTQTATFKRLTDARRWVQSTESALRENRHFKTTEAKRHTLSEAIDKYAESVAPGKFKPNELRIRLPILNWWKAEIGYCLLSDISAKDFASCRDSLVKLGGTEGKPLAAATVRRYFITINHVLKICCQEWHWMEQNPLKDGVIELPELPGGIVRFLSDDELARLSLACKRSPNELLYPAFMVSICTGMRQAETMNLYWREPAIPPKQSAWGVVNLAENHVILHQTKNSRKRRVPIAVKRCPSFKDYAKREGLTLAWCFQAPHIHTNRLSLRSRGQAP